MWGPSKKKSPLPQHQRRAALARIRAPNRVKPAEIVQRRKRKRAPPRRAAQPACIPPSCWSHLQLVARHWVRRRKWQSDRFKAGYSLVWVCFFYHFLVSPQVMERGGCRLLARHSFTADPPTLHKSPFAPLCFGVSALGSPSTGRVFLPRSSPLFSTLVLRDRKTLSSEIVFLFFFFNAPSPLVGKVKPKQTV